MEIEILKTTDLVNRYSIYSIQDIQKKWIGDVLEFLEWIGDYIDKDQLPPIKMVSDRINSLQSDAA